MILPGIAIVIVDRWGIVSPAVVHHGIAGVSPPESTHNYFGIAREASSGIGPHKIYWDCREERLLE